MATLSHLKTMLAHLSSSACDLKDRRKEHSLKEEGKMAVISIHIYLVLDATNYPVEAFFTKQEAEKYLKHYSRNSKLRMLSILVRHF